MKKSTTFSETRVQLHLNTISKNANRARAYSKNANGARGEVSLWCRKGRKRRKRFVKVHFHCIIRNLKKDKRNIDVAHPRKIYVVAHGRKCCSLPVSLVVNVQFTTNGMCMKNNTQVARTSRNKISMTWDLYCCLLPQCEALHTCC